MSRGIVLALAVAIGAVLLVWVANPFDAKDGGVARPEQERDAATSAGEAGRPDVPDFDEAVAGASESRELLETGSGRPVADGSKERLATEWRGWVLDAVTGRPVVGAHVKGRRRSRFETHEAWSDEAGAFSLFTFSRPTAVVSCEGYEGVKFRFEDDHQKDGASIFLTPLAGLEVSVVDEAGTPRERARVVVVRGNKESWKRGVRGTWNEATDSDGWARFDALPAGVPLFLKGRHSNEFSLSVSMHPENEPLELVPGEVRQFHWIVPTGVTVSGHLVDQFGAPVPKAPLWLVRAEAEGAAYLSSKNDRAARTLTKADGSFEFHQVPDGAWTVGPAPGGSIAALGVPVTVDGRDRVVRVECASGLYIRGRIRDSKTGRLAMGESTEIFSVVARSTDGRGSVSVTNKKDGSFQVGPLAPGTYEIFIEGLTQKAMTEAIPVEPGTDGLELELDFDAYNEELGKLLEGLSYISD